MPHLTVHQPFGTYNRGDHISDPAEVENVLKEHAQSVAPFYPSESHVNGDFYRTDAEIAARLRPAETPKADRSKGELTKTAA